MERCRQSISFSATLPSKCVPMSVPKCQKLGSSCCPCSSVPRPCRAAHRDWRIYPAPGLSWDHTEPQGPVCSSLRTTRKCLFRRTRRFWCPARAQIKLRHTPSLSVLSALPCPALQGSARPPKPGIVAGVTLAVNSSPSL